MKEEMRVMPETRRTASRLLKAVALLGLLAVPAAVAPAQPAPAQPASAQAAAAAPRGEGLDRTVARFGDWSVTCAIPEEATARACEMALAVRNPGRQLSAVMAIGRAAQDARMRLVVQVPVNVRVAQPLQLVTEGGDPLRLGFRSCNALGCFAELDLRNEALLRRLRSRPAEQMGRVEWSDAAGHAVALPISFRGFSAALDGLLREGA